MQPGTTACATCTSTCVFCVFLFCFLPLFIFFLPLSLHSFSDCGPAHVPGRTDVETGLQLNQETRLIPAVLHKSHQNAFNPRMSRPGTQRLGRPSPQPETNSYCQFAFQDFLYECSKLEVSHELRKMRSPEHEGQLGYDHLQWLLKWLRTEGLMWAFKNNKSLARGILTEALIWCPLLVFITSRFWAFSSLKYFLIFWIFSFFFF